MQPSLVYLEPEGCCGLRYIPPLRGFDPKRTVDCNKLEHGSTQTSKVLINIGLYPNMKGSGGPGSRLQDAALSRFDTPSGCGTSLFQVSGVYGRRTWKRLVPSRLKSTRTVFKTIALPHIPLH